MSIGGEISVDIYLKGMNKAQVIDKLLEIHGPQSTFVFVGDKNIPGGNDWPLAQRLESMEGCEWLQVYNYEETRALIEYSELFI